jgi:hypothetical protein
MHAARNSDPITSHLAAEENVVSGRNAAQQDLTAKAVERYPGLTSLELSKRSRIDRYTLARRLSECEKAGLVKRGPATRCSVSKRMAVTWWRPDDVVQLSLVLAA